MKLILIILVVLFLIHFILRFYNSKDLYEILVFGIDENQNPTGRYYNLKFRKSLLPLSCKLKNMVYYSERFYNVNNLDKNEQIELSFSFYIKNVIANNLLNRNLNESIGFIDFKDYIRQKFPDCELDFEKENFDRKVFSLMFIADKQNFMNYGKREIDINSFFHSNKISYYYDDNNKFTPLLSYITNNNLEINNTIVINFEHFISENEIVKIYKYKSKKNKIEIDIHEFQNYLYSLMI